jgi:hypothetical protein
MQHPHNLRQIDIDLQWCDRLYWPCDAPWPLVQQNFTMPLMHVQNGVVLRGQVPKAALEACAQSAMLGTKAVLQG